VLRIAIAGILGVIDVEQVGPALANITDTMLTGALELARRGLPAVEFGIIALGRYGGRELGFGSDADVIYVYRATEARADDASANHAIGAGVDEAHTAARTIVSRLAEYTEDLRLPLDLDIDLRPEGKDGPVVRSLDSYRAYYARWSLTWEAQALLRAHGVVGDERLLRDFEHLADETRYPSAIPEHDVREVRRIKARVESERLPQGADPARHVKLGRGSLSDVEWCVQLIQLRHAAEHPRLRTTSTLKALKAATDAGFLTSADAATLRAAWIFCSRVRSAMTLWTVRTIDVLPVDRRQLEGVARLMEYPPGSASRLEDDYLRVTRRARKVFERQFYDGDARA
jgi:glutamate-ammonia-ligase adenylyltransferase